MKHDKNYKTIREYDKVNYNNVVCTAYYSNDFKILTLLNDNQEVQLETDDETVDCEVECVRDEDTDCLL